MIEQNFFIKMLALTSRATLARRVGKFLAMLGIHLVLIGIVTKLFSPTFLPSKSTFSLDVPESIIRTEASTPGASL
ncbi:hypothetical protein I7V28_19185 [Lelliottia amnigena]|uniref:hypothetical protein n=1 Tax=Lelliottia TaxID=1330545 RepID=UPI00192B4D74|nr:MULTISPECIES: hypothetical protein [Lelliottia]MBL5885629.1 hypothetical protein [Lelliottia aquatilis]MBL5923207.1 hypothetical protein [Lelliottia amnigena]MBL5932117.1 hypothetical protein [Lelliottia amnigena]